MKRIKIKVIKILLKALTDEECFKMLWRVLTDERYTVVSLDEWNENTRESWNRGYEEAVKMAVKMMEDQATEC